MADSKKKNILSIALCAFAVIAIALSSFGATYARYNKISVCSFVYGENYEEKNTLSAEGRVYDFGIWRNGSTNEFMHTLVLESADALRGELSFSWDSATEAASDIALDGGSGVRAVNETDGVFSMPISLHANSSRSAVATLDVKWTPDNAEESVLTARYFIALNPEASAAQKPAFGGATGFLSKELLLLEASAPSGSRGLIVTPGEGLAQNFKSGTKYYNSTYPQGVTLVSNSAIYLSGESVSTLFDLTANGVGETLKICIGTSTSNYATSTLTAKKDAALSVTADSDSILSHTNPFTVNIAEAAALYDAAWNTAGSGAAQLSWSIERLVDGEYINVSTGENLTAQLERSGAGGSITLGAPTGEQAAGTYRIKITQKYGGLKIGEVTKWFFIDYR